MNTILTAPDQHVYHHSDPKRPTVNVTVTRNTKGLGWEVTVNGAESPEEAVALAEETISALREIYGGEEVAA